MTASTARSSLLSRCTSGAWLRSSSWSYSGRSPILSSLKLKSAGPSLISAFASLRLMRFLAKAADDVTDLLWHPSSSMAGSSQIRRRFCRKKGRLDSSSQLRQPRRQGCLPGPFDTYPCDAQAAARSVGARSPRWRLRTVSGRLRAMATVKSSGWRGTAALILVLVLPRCRRSPSPMPIGWPSTRNSACSSTPGSTRPRNRSPKDWCSSPRNSTGRRNCS